MHNSPKLCLQPSNVASIWTRRIVWFNENHNQQVVSRNGHSENQVRSLRDENDTLDDKGEHADPKCLLRTKCAKEVRFCDSVAMMMKDGAEVGVRLSLLSYTEKKIVTIKE